MAIAFVFPGQGSQSVGMGRALAEAFPIANAVFDEVDEALGQKLSEIMWNGAQDELTLTQNAQPALMAHSIAVVRVLEAEYGIAIGKTAKFVAGHSLGEYSALAAVGAIGLFDTAKLLRLRGEAMQRAVPIGQGAMAALLGVGVDVAEKVAAEAAQGEVCDVANDNEPSQVVLSGHKTAIDRVEAIGKAHGVRRAVQLPVSAPFHCSLMEPAAEAMKDALVDVEISRPAVPVVCNVTALAIDDPAEIRSRLVEQVTGRVRWRESVMAMHAHGVTNLYELGSGKVLSGLARRIETALDATYAGTPDELAELATKFNAAT